MSLPAGMLPNTCDVYRPFGAGSPTTTGVACRLVADFPGGRGGAIGAGYFFWTHYLDLNPSADVRDGCGRSAGANALNYADGDEVRIAGTTYVVVWVEVRNRGTAQECKRAHLLRDAPSWPGP
jgi:hypothetical protein